ncbi:HNH endonuclease [Leifsonia sp. NPDC014704]|uniref:HNH endonuclease n=1 Tax=Leifsonia sp. NPDC014704 TaxID=3364123 RepID=UPI0036F494EE
MSKAPRNTAQRDRDRDRIRRTAAACGICGEPIDYALKWPEKRCFVVDHVVPLHRGGLDVIGNKQAAHNECNSAKRARIVAPIVRRSGSLA